MPATRSSFQWMRSSSSASQAMENSSFIMLRHEEPSNLSNAMVSLSPTRLRSTIVRRRPWLSVTPIERCAGACPPVRAITPLPITRAASGMTKWYTSELLQPWTTAPPFKAELLATRLLGPRRSATSKCSSSEIRMGVVYRGATGPHATHPASAATDPTPNRVRARRILRSFQNWH